MSFNVNPFDVEVLMERCELFLITRDELAPLVTECWRSVFDDQMRLGMFDADPVTADTVNAGGLHNQLFYLSTQLGVLDVAAKLNEIVERRER